MLYVLCTRYIRGHWTGLVRTFDRLKCIYLLAHKYILVIVNCIYLFSLIADVNYRLNSSGLLYKNDVLHVYGSSRPYSTKWCTTILVHFYKLVIYCCVAFDVIFWVETKFIIHYKWESSVTTNFIFWKLG